MPDVSWYEFKQFQEVKSMPKKVMDNLEYLEKVKKELNSEEVRNLNLPAEMVMAFHSNRQAKALEIIAEELCKLNEHLDNGINVTNSY